MKIAIIGSIVCLSFCATWAQPPSATSEIRMRNAQGILLKTPHRVKTTVEMRERADSSWQLYSSQTREVVGKDRWHLIQHTGLKLEIIGIEGTTYQKMPDGSWKVGRVGDGYTGGTVRTISKPVEKSIVNEEKDGSKVVDTRTQWTLEVNRTGEIVDMDRKTREWFDEAGRLVRVETDHFNFERKKFQRNTEIYEYDPSIRIEAPITN